MNLIIAGSRHLQVTNAEIAQFLKTFNLNPTSIISGGANGIDKCAHRFAFENGIFFREYLPDWSLYGLAAGPKRNERMAIAGDALLLIWDGKSRGSKNMQTQARRCQKPIYEIILGSAHENT